MTIIINIILDNKKLGEFDNYFQAAEAVYFYPNNIPDKLSDLDISAINKTAMTFSDSIQKGENKSVLYDAKSDTEIEIEEFYE
jgi:hypothetical protein